ncbi:Gfo/Idh/MocA family oxidoreductase, partial [Hungatella sp. SL.1.14]|uniref:Gfo/Idh/MocA family protein n=1 Tax=Hungatella sp. SL.1.14 TaxID=2963703 RepID=UPI00210BEE5C
DHIDTLLKKYDLEENLSIKRYENYKQMIEENKLELIRIATESGLHAEIALYCIDHGINIIIEKPMAINISDAEEIIRRSEANGVKVSACHQNRFNIAVQ